MSISDSERVIIRSAPRSGAVKLAGRSSTSSRLESVSPEMETTTNQPESPKPFFKNSKVMTTTREEDSDLERPITPPPSMAKRKALLATKSKPSLSEQAMGTSPTDNGPARVNVSGKGLKINQLDLSLVRMGFTILFAFPVAEAKTEQTQILLTMTPIGTLVGVRLDMEGGITTSAERRITMRASSGNETINSSYLANVAKHTELASLVICREGVCVLARDNLGKIAATHYEIKSEANKEMIVSTETPTCYPLISLSEVMSYYSASSGEVKTASYATYLDRLREESEKLNARQVMEQAAILEQNIEFMQNLVTNLRNVHERVVDFTKANRLELEKTSSTALTMLKQRLTSATLSQEGTDAWAETQARLTSLNYNNATVLNGLHTFNSSRAALDGIDREASSFYFTLYNRVIRSMEAPLNTGIRSPDAWALGKVLPRAEEALHNRQAPKATEFSRLVREEVAAFDPRYSDAETALLVKTFQSCFH